MACRTVGALAFALLFITGMAEAGIPRRRPRKRPPTRQRERYGPAYRYPQRTAGSFPSYRRRTSGWGYRYAGP